MWAVRQFSPIGLRRLTTTSFRLAAPKVVKARPKRDEEISSPLIAFVNEQGELERNVKVQDVLKSIDRSTYFLLEVDPLAKPQPVCRLVPKKQLFDKQKELKKKLNAQNAESIVKEVSFGWNVAPNDIGHKLSKARQFLEKGNKVKLDILAKKGAARVSRDHQADLIERVKNELGDLGKLSKEPVMTRGTAQLMFEPQGGK